MYQREGKRKREMKKLSIERERKRENGSTCPNSDTEV